MATFSELGIPFPLFEAPTSEASDYAGQATCRLCGGPDRHCFDLGSRNSLILPCPSCGIDNGLIAADRADKPCRSCGRVVPFPEALRTKKQLLVCYDCLRAGRAAFSKATEFGGVTEAQAFDGVTDGVPGLRTDQFEVVPVHSEEDWYGVRVPAEHLWELLRTPGFHSWQDERWLFCCRQPMSYLGDWRDAVEVLRPEDQDSFFQSLLDPDDEVRQEGFEAFEAGSICLYVYRCRSCFRCRATWDCD